MREGFAALAQRADKYARERSPVLKGLLRIRRTASKKLRTHSKRENYSLGFIRRGLLGFAGLAPHSGRSSVPFRLTLFRDRRYFPSNSTTPNHLEPPHSGKNLP